MDSLRRSRLRHRLVRHHVPLFLLTVLSIVVLYATRPYSDVISKASFATAYPATFLLALTLMLGPWNLLRRRRNPVSSDLRRDIGIWAGMVGVVHAVVGQCVHLRGRPWLYYLYGPQEHHHAFPIRHDLFGLANYSGAVSVLLLALLLATSNDYSLRCLGTPGWKKLQRWNYAIFALAAVHSFAYQGVEKQKFPYVMAIAACVTTALFFQMAGVLSRRATAALPGGTKS